MGISLRAYLSLSLLPIYILLSLTTILSLCKLLELQFNIISLT